MAGPSPSLEFIRLKPSIDEIEILTTMVNLGIIKSREPPVFEKN